MPRDFDAASTRRPLFDALLDAKRRVGGAKPIIEDQDRKPLSYTDFVRGSFALGRKLKPLTAPGERVGLLLPSSVGMAVTFFALHAIGRTPVMLNFTSGVGNLKAACKAAGVKRVLSAKRFVQQAKLDALVAELGEGVEITYLDELRASIGPTDKAYALVAGAFPRQFRVQARPDDIGVILFTSGSFGAPRGVVLTQANLLANVEQVAAHIELDPEWVFFNPLPTFHALGLIALMLPLLRGMRGFHYPSPLHFKQIPGLVRETGAAVLFGTDTFVNQYARAAAEGDLTGLKFLVCGAEKVRDETHRMFPGVPVLEGYGATEASPVIAVNQPDHNRAGTVGRLLPGLEARVEPVEGVAEGGRLYVRGPNVMAGYLGATPDVIEPLPGGWHDTGDVVAMDQEGVVRILGRVKRFAKLGGEMVSLLAVEEMLGKLWPTGRHAVVSVPDARKGERLVLFTEQADADVGAIAAFARAEGAPELAVPKKIVRVDEVPVLGSGKTDYVSLQKLAEQDEGSDRTQRAEAGVLVEAPRETAPEELRPPAE